MFYQLRIDVDADETKKPEAELMAFDGSPDIPIGGSLSTTADGDIIIHVGVHRFKIPSNKFKEAVQEIEIRSRLASRKKVGSGFSGL